MLKPVVVGSLVHTAALVVVMAFVTPVAKTPRVVVNANGKETAFAVPGVA